MSLFLFLQFLSLVSLYCTGFMNKRLRWISPMRTVSNIHILAETYPPTCGQATRPARLRKSFRWQARASSETATESAFWEEQGLSRRQASMLAYKRNKLGSMSRKEVARRVAQFAALAPGIWSWYVTTTSKVHELGALIWFVDLFFDSHMCIDIKCEILWHGHAWSLSLFFD